MIIIVEGPDLSGKTYAIEKIAKHFNSGFVLKNSFKPKTLEDTDKIFAQYWTILSKVIDTEGLVILDRFFPSQAVYSYLRGEDHMSHPEIRTLDKYCREKDILYIYLDTPRQILWSRYDIRGDEHVTKDMLMTLKERYDEFYERTEMKKIKIDTMQPNWLEKLEGWLK